MRGAQEMIALATAGISIALLFIVHEAYTTTGLSDNGLYQTLLITFSMFVLGGFLSVYLGRRKSK